MFKFNYHGDEIVVYPSRLIKFLWANLMRSKFKSIGITPTTSPFFSHAYGEYFNQFSDYWRLVGKKSALVELLQRNRSLTVQGFHFKETLLKFSRAEYPDTPVVVYFDVAADQIARLLERLPGGKIKTFMEEIVCIPCKTREEAKRLVKATPYSIGECFAAIDGIEISSNVDNAENLLHE